MRIAELHSKSSKKTDSTQAGAKLVPLGRLLGPHGLRGELRFQPYAFPCPTLRDGLSVLVQSAEGVTVVLVVQSVRPRPPLLLVTFQGIDSRTQAESLHNTVVAVEESLLPPLQEGEFYYHQVVGLHVYTSSGEQVGTIAEVFFSGGHDVWVVRQGKKEYLIPVTEEIVRRIDIAGGQVIIEPMAGLLE